MDAGDPVKSCRITPVQICSFSIPLITIVATFVFKLFLPIVMLVFELWFLLRLKFCIPPSIEVRRDSTPSWSRARDVRPDVGARRQRQTGGFDASLDAGFGAEARRQALTADRSGVRTPALLDADRGAATAATGPTSTPGLERRGARDPLDVRSPSWMIAA